MINMPNLKNIIIVNDWASRDGGAASVAINSALALAKTFNVFLFCAVGPVDQKIIDSQVHVIFLDKPDILRDTNRLRAIVRGLWDYKVRRLFSSFLSQFSATDTIIHVHTWTKSLSSSIFGSISKTNFQVVVTLHDYFVFCPNGGFYNYNKKVICTQKPLSMSCICTNCDVRSYSQKIWRVLRQFIQNFEIKKNHNLHFISISNYTDKICVPLIHKNHKIFKLYDPVELSFREKVNIQNNVNYLCMARLSPEKGVDLFCKAISELGLSGIVLGDGEQLNYLKAKYPSIQFVGWIESDKKQKYFNKAKAFVFTSLWYETFGLTVAEAKSYGIPCIVPDNCAASEQVENGKTGLLFKTGDLNSLKEAILRYEHSDISQMQNNLVNSFDTAKLSLNTHINNLVKIYNEILKR